MTDILTMEDFKDKVGDEFTLQVSDGVAVKARLAELKPATAHPVPGRARDPFSLMFDGEPGHRLPQRIYRFDHASGKSYEIFIVPIQHNPQTDALRYQAVFN